MKKIFSLLTGLLLSCSLAFCAGIDENTKLYLPLNCVTSGHVTCNGGLEVLDAGSEANIITSVGTAAYQTTTTKVWNAAIQLDSDSDYLTFDTLKTTLANDTSGAISLWFRPTFSNGTTGQRIISFQGTTANETYFTITYVSDTTLLSIALGIDTTQQWRWVYSLPFSLNSFYNLAISHNGTTPTFYVNGTDVTALGSFATEIDKSKWMRAIMIDATTDVSMCTIGADRNPTRFFGGQIADVRMWSSTLTSGNATTLYGSGSGTTSAIGSEVFWIKGCQDLSGTGGSGVYSIVDYEGTFQLSTGKTFLAGDGTSAIADGDSDSFVTEVAAKYNLADGNFGIDGRFQFDAANKDQALWEIYVDASNYLYLWWDYVNGSADLLQIKGAVGGTTKIDYTVNWEPSANTAYHIEAVRSGTTIYLFIDGTALTLTEVTAVSTNSLIGANASFRTGKNVILTKYLDGYTAHVRVQGSATHTSNFTPPTAPYSYESGTTYTGRIISIMTTD